jgi:hypothetical protein
MAKEYGVREPRGKLPSFQRRQAPSLTFGHPCKHRQDVFALLKAAPGAMVYESAIV